jgi:transcriptional regulator with XRE-family HTH domain
MQLTLKDARREKAWSVDELARRAGVHKSTVSRLERGLVGPTLRTAEALERALGLARGGLRFFADDVDDAQVGVGAQEA